MKNESKSLANVFVLSELDFCTKMATQLLDDSNIEEYKNVAIISITDPHREGKQWFKNNHSNVLNLFFNDATPTQNYGYTQDYVDNGNEVVLFDDDMAMKVLSFMFANSGKDTWYIHCMAGISRSGTVGKFIADFLLINPAHFKYTNPNIHLNSYVWDVLSNVYAPGGFKPEEISSETCMSNIFSKLNACRWLSNYANLHEVLAYRFLDENDWNMEKTIEHLKQQKDK